MSIIVCGGTKGGTGKSTTATNLAIISSYHGNKVLLIDADDQETSADFTMLRNELTNDKAGYTCIKLLGASVRTEVQRLAENYDHIIIDTGGRDSASQRAALVVADILLVPIIPRSFDIWTLGKVTKIVEEMKFANENLQPYIFLNRADPQGTDNHEASAYLKESPVFTFLDAPLGYRKAFGNAQSKGLAVNEFQPIDHKAEREILTLFSYVFKVDLDLNQTKLIRGKKHGTYDKS